MLSYDITDDLNCWNVYFGNNMNSNTTANNHSIIQPNMFDYMSNYMGSVSLSNNQELFKQDMNQLNVDNNSQYQLLFQNFEHLQLENSVNLLQQEGNINQLGNNINLLGNNINQLGNNINLVESKLNQLESNLNLLQVEIHENDSTNLKNHKFPIMAENPDSNLIFDQALNQNFRYNSFNAIEHLTFGRSQYEKESMNIHSPPMSSSSAPSSVAAWSNSNLASVASQDCNVVQRSKSDGNLDLCMEKPATDRQLHIINYGIRDYQSGKASQGFMDYTMNKSSFGSSRNTNNPSVEKLIRQDKEMWEFVTKKSRKKGTYKCAHCSDHFKTLESFIYHIDADGLAAQRVNKCSFDHCPYKYIGFPRRAELRRHTQAIHGATLRLLVNSTAQTEHLAGSANNHYNYRISSESNTSSPVVDIFSTPITSFSPSSNISPLSADKLSLELNNVPENTNRSAKHDDKTQSVIHSCTVVRPYCTKSFPRKDSLQRHIRLCHDNPHSRFNKGLKKRQHKEKTAAKKRAFQKRR